MLTTVAGNPAAIGYVSLGSLNDTVTAVKIDGAEATAERRQGDVQEAGERKSPDAEGTAEKRRTETERAGQGEFQADP